MIGVKNRKHGLRVTVLAAALLGVYGGGIALAAPAEPVVVENGEKLNLTGGEYTSATAKTAGALTADKVTVSGSKGSSESGLVFVDGSGSIMLENSTVLNTVGSFTGGARGVNARGAGATIDLIGTNVTLDSVGIDNANAGSVIAATFGGKVNIDGGVITSKGAYVRGLAAVGDPIGAPAGGELIKASNLTINTLDERGFGVQVYGNPSGNPDADTTVDLSNVDINTQGVYALGIQSRKEGAKVVGSEVRITTTNTNAHGIEASDGASVNLVGGSINTSGAGATGVMAYTGAATPTVQLKDFAISTTGSAAHGVVAGPNTDVTLDGGSVTVGDAYGLYAVGAGSSISATNAVAVVSAGQRAVFVDNQARVDMVGGSITNTRTTGNAASVFVNGSGSTFNGQNITVHSTAPGAAKGVVAEMGGHVTIDGGSIETTGAMNSHAIDSYWDGSVIKTTGVDVRSTGYAAGAFDGGQVILDGGTFDVVGTTATEKWDTAAGFVVGGGRAGSKLSANNIRLINSAPLVNAPPATASYAMRVGADFGTPLVSNAELSLTDSEVIASGQQRRIALIENSSHLIAAGSQLTSEQEAGIVLSGNASLTLANSTVAAHKESLAAASKGGTTQSISITGGAKVVQNNGTLLQVTRPSEGSDGVVNLALSGGAVAVGNIRDEGVKVGGATNLTLQDNAQWTGGLFGVDDIQIRSGSSFTETGGQVVRDGLSMDDGVKVAFTNGVTLNKQFAAKGGTQASFSGASKLNGGVVVDGSGSTFNGHGAAISVTASSDLQAGVRALNGATVNLTNGSINAQADGTKRARGILAMKGASVATNGTTIATTGNKSHAVHAQIDKGDKTSLVPTVSINGGSITVSGHESWGLFSQRGGKITSSAHITTHGKAGFGAFVESNNENDVRGGLITLNGGSIETMGQQLDGAEIGSFGALAKNIGNHIEVNGTRISTSGAYADGLRAEDKATIRATNAAITVSGDETAAVKALGGAKIEMIGGSVVNNSLRDKTRGAAAEGAGSEFKATNTHFQVAGEGTPAYSVQGVRAAEGGKVILEGGSILTTALGGAQGLRAQNATAQATGVAITTVGNRSYGVYSNNHSAVALAQTNINTHGQFAHGVLVGDNSGASISNSSIRTRGNNASGVRAESSTSGMPGGALTVSNSQIRTSGANAHGVDLNGGSSLVMTGGSIHATGSGSAGVYLLNNSSATLNGVSVVAGGPSLQSYFSGPERSQTITIGAGTSLMQNNGTLLQVTRGTNQAQTTSGADGKVTLNLQSGSYASGNIRNFDANGNLASGALTSVVVQPGAQWAGVVVDNSTKIIENDQAPQTDFSTGDGESVVIEGGSAPHVFNGTTNIGGGSSIGPNQQVVFNGPTTIRDNLVGQQGSGMIIGGPATIGGSVTGAQGSTIAFNGPATITQSLQGAGGALFSFAGGASIGLNVSGMDGAAFRFSQLGVTSIGGNIDLDGGSVIGGGSQAAPITVAGNANVGNNSVLGGNLNIRGDLRMNGSSLAPGNSIGRVVVNSASQLTDSTYLAEVNGKGEADLIVVQTGDVNLTGVNLRVGQENGNGGYLLNHDYTIVQTEAGNIVGPFANGGELDSSFAGTLVKLDPVKYGAKATQVSLSLDASKVSGARTGLTGNQPAVFDGALSVVGRNASADAVMLMGTTEQRRNALDQLSGEIHGSTTAALYGASNLLGSTVSRRMAGNLGAGKLAGSPTAQASGAAAGSLPKSAAYPLWAEVVGNWNTLDAKDNASKTKTDTAGIYIGADTAVGRGWRVGAALGFTDGRIKADDVGSRSDVRSYTAALYGGNSWAAGKGQVNLLAGAGYTRHEVDSRRRIDVGGSQTLKADYDANTTQLFAELGYAMPVGQASVLEPYAGLAWFSNHSKSFSESGGAAALQGDSQRDNITTFTLGLRGKTALDLKGKQARLSAGLGWRHAAGDVDAQRTMSFIQGNGAAFTVAGSPVAKNAAVVDLGAEMDVGKNAAMGLGYSGQFGNGSTDNSGSLYLKVRF